VSATSVTEHGRPSSTLSRGGLDGTAFRRVVASLCATEIVSYGVLYYAFAVLNGSIVADTGWPVVLTTLAFCLGQVVAAVGGIAVGRILDQHGPRLVMTVGSVVGGPALALVALAPNEVAFIAGWALAGVAMAAVFYTPAFSAITHWGGDQALRGLTAVTLVAGFASTVFGPLTAWLNGPLGWRGAFLVLAALLLAVTVPLHALGLRGQWTPATRHDAADADADAPIGRPFVLLAIAMSAASLVEYGTLVQLVPLLVARGLTTTQAALVLGVGGAGQVAGRLVYGRIASATGVVPRTVATFLLVGVTSEIFAALAAMLGVMLAVTALAGFARGCVTLLLATAVPDRWGVYAIGRRNGLLSAPVMLSAAVAPFLVAVAQHATTDEAAFYMMAAIVAAAALLVPRTIPQPLRP
jgi:MFS family permease